MRIEANLDIQYEIYKPKNFKLLMPKTLPITENTVSTESCRILRGIFLLIFINVTKPAQWFSLLLGWNHDHDNPWCATFLVNFSFSHNNEQRM